MSGFPTRRLGAALLLAAAVTVGLASPAHAADAGSISGHLLDTAGNPAPVSGVTVFDPSTYTTVASGTTAPDGSFSISPVPAGTYQISFQRPDGLTQWAYQKRQQWSADQIAVTAGADAVVNETLIPSGTIDGTLTDASGNPAPDVDVWAQDSTTFAMFSARTDTSGRYSIPVFAGSYQVSFHLANGLVQFAHQQLAQNAAASFDVAGGQDVRVDEQLLPTGSMSGRFTGTDGQPIAGEHVTIMVPNWASTQYTETDSNGEFHIPALFAGSYTVEFYSPDWSRSQWAYGKRFEEQADLIAVRGGQDTRVDDTALGTGSVTVTAADAVTGAAVTNFCAGSGWSWGCADSTGKVVLTGLYAGSNSVSVTTDDPFHLMSPNNPVTVVAGQNTDLVVKLQPAGVIDATVRDRVTGAAVANTCVAALAAGSAVTNELDHFCTDAAGAVRLPQLTAGTYILYALPRDGSHGSQWVGTAGGTGDQREAAKLTVTAGAATRAPTILLDGAGSVTGVVTGPDGAPVKYGVVDTLSFNPGYGPSGQFTSTGADGRYTLGGLGPYTWPLFYQSYGLASQWSGGVANRYDAAGTTITVGGTATANATLTTGSTLTGTLTSTAPVSFARLTAYNKVSGDIMGFADAGADGHYTMTLLGDQSVNFYYEASVGGQWVRGWFQAPDRDHATTIGVPSSGTKTVDVQIPAP